MPGASSSSMPAEPEARAVEQLRLEADGEQVLAGTAVARAARPRSAPPDDTRRRTAALTAAIARDLEDPRRGARSPWDQRRDVRPMTTPTQVMRADGRVAARGAGPEERVAAGGDEQRHPGPVRHEARPTARQPRVVRPPHASGRSRPAAPTTPSATSTSPTRMDVTRSPREEEGADHLRAARAPHLAAADDRPRSCRGRRAGPAARRSAPIPMARVGEQLAQARARQQRRPGSAPATPAARCRS